MDEVMLKPSAKQKTIPLVLIFNVLTALLNNLEVQDRQIRHSATLVIAICFSDDCFRVPILRLHIDATPYCCSNRKRRSPQTDCLLASEILRYRLLRARQRGLFGPFDIPSLPERLRVDFALHRCRHGSRRLIQTLAWTQIGSPIHTGRIIPSRTQSKITVLADI
jgi:hypothetical protein